MLRITSVMKYLSVFLVYFFVDATYQMVFGIEFTQKIQEEAGIRPFYSEGIENPILLLIWFGIMTVAIVKLVVEPAVRLKSVKKAVLWGMILGVTAYSTLAMPNGWSIANYPTALVIEIVLEGLLFAPISSAVTAFWLIRREKKMNN